MRRARGYHTANVRVACGFAPLRGVWGAERRVQAPCSRYTAGLSIGLSLNGIIKGSEPPAQAIARHERQGVAIPCSVEKCTRRGIQGRHLIEQGAVAPCGLPVRRKGKTPVSRQEVHPAFPSSPDDFAVIRSGKTMPGHDLRDLKNYTGPKNILALSAVPPL